MKHALAVLLGLLGSAALAAGSEPWLSKDFPSANEGQLAVLIPESLFFEVPVSRLAAAESLLAKDAAVAQESSMAQYFGRPAFACPAATSLFLLRAVYTNGGTGAFQISALPGDSVWVSHHSLGRSTGTHRSALLACLKKRPTRVLVSSGGAI